MPLALSVTLIVVVVFGLVGVSGYLLDRSVDDAGD